jgi:hypothetical protein
MSLNEKKHTGDEKNLPRDEIRHLENKKITGMFSAEIYTKTCRGEKFFAPTDVLIISIMSDFGRILILLVNTILDRKICF